jgi:acyl-ACP thioesterase
MAATDKYATIEELLEVVFSVRSQKIGLFSHINFKIFMYIISNHVFRLLSLF